MTTTPNQTPTQNQTSAQSPIEFRCTIKRMFNGCPKANGWFGCFAHIRGSADDIKLIGTTDLNLCKGMDLQVTAHENKKFNAYEADTIQIITKTTIGIKNYLASIKGISTSTAKLLVSHYGTKTLKMLQDDPDTIKQDTGLTDKQIDMINNAIQNADKANQLKQAFPELSDKAIKKICSAKGGYKNKHNINDIITYITDNPYHFNDVPGVTFPIMDAIALRVGISPTSEFRVNHALTDLLKHNATGNVFVNLNNFNEFSQLKYQLEQKLNIQLTDNELAGRLIHFSQIANSPITIEKINNESHLYLSEIYNQMMALVKDINYRKKQTGLLSTKTTQLVSRHIPLWCAQTGIILTDEQKAAVVNALTHNISIITGGPGRGKTKVIQCIADIAKAFADAQPVLLAPTGKAVNKLLADTDREYAEHTMTIDRLINSDPEGSTYNSHKLNYIVLIDESSMIDIVKAARFMEHMHDNCHLCFVGDINQLPPIDAGFFFKELIDSGDISTSVITKSLRNSHIIADNSDRINNMDINLQYDLHEMPLFPIFEENDDMLTFILDQYNDERTNCPDITQIALLSPMRKGTVGVINLNIKIQETACPEISGSPSAYCAPRGRTMFSTKGFPIYNTIYGNSQHYTNFRIGDIVINTKNDYSIDTHRFKNDDYFNGKKIDQDSGIYNGDCGRIIAYWKDTEDIEWIAVQMFDGRVAELNLSVGEFDTFELGYAMTVHKSQGCEYDTVIYISPDSMSRMTAFGFGNKNLVYTAVTRARKRVVIIGSKIALNDCIKTPLIQHNCDLHERI